MMAGEPGRSTRFSSSVSPLALEMGLSQIPRGHSTLSETGQGAGRRRDTWRAGSPTSTSVGLTW